MKKQKERPGVMLYFHLLNPLKNIPREAFGELIWALIQYAQGGETPVFTDPMQEMGWAFLQHASDLDQVRYAERCEQGRLAAEKRWGKTNANHADPCQPISADANDTKYSTNTQAQANTETETNANASAAAPTTTAADAQTDSTAPPASSLPCTNGSHLPDIVAQYLPVKKTTPEEAARLKAEALAKLRALPPDAW